MKDNRGESRYENWYVLQVRTNKEKFVLDFINRMMENKVKIMTFMKDIIHTRSNRDIKWEIPLFPGYIFVHKDISRVTEFLKSRLTNEFFRPIKFDGKFARVDTREMKFLLSNSDDDGKIPLSYAYKDGDMIRITRGPLMNMTGKIEFINIKKRKANISFMLFQQKMNISLGIDFIDAYDGNKSDKEQVFY